MRRAWVGSWQGLVARAVGPLAVAWWLLWRPGYDGALWALAVMGVASALAFVAAGPPPPRGGLAVSR